MAFGNRPQNTKSRRRPEPDAKVEEENAEEEEKGFHPEFFGYVTAMLATAATFAGLIIAAPHTYSAPDARVNWGKVTAGADIATMADETREAFLDKYGIDYSRILTPASEEETPGSSAVSSRCNKANPSRRVVSHIESPRMFRLATSYLVCAMKVERDRFCNSADRARLVEQLMVYRERRKDIFALNKVFDEITGYLNSNPDYKMPRYLTASTNRDGQREINKVLITEQMHPRITEGLATLVTNGYLSASDFGYFGLYLPEEYSAVLTETPVQQRLCS